MQKTNDRFIKFSFPFNGNLTKLIWNYTLLSTKFVGNYPFHFLKATTRYVIPAINRTTNCCCCCCMPGGIL